MLSKLRIFLDAVRKNDPPGDFMMSHLQNMNKKGYTLPLGHCLKTGRELFLCTRILDLILRFAFSCKTEGMPGSYFLLVQYTEPYIWNVWQWDFYSNTEDSLLIKHVQKLFITIMQTTLTALTVFLKLLIGPRLRLITQI
jgi:hypothetical protein